MDKKSRHNFLNFFIGNVAKFYKFREKKTQRTKITQVHKLLERGKRQPVQGSHPIIQQSQKKKKKSFNYNDVCSVPSKVCLFLAK